MICSTCNYKEGCNIANSLFILAGMHGIAIDITHCPVAKVEPGRVPEYNPETPTQSTKPDKPSAFVQFPGTA